MEDVTQGVKGRAPMTDVTVYAVTDERELVAGLTEVLRKYEGRYARPVVGKKKRVRRST